MAGCLPLCLLGDVSLVRAWSPRQKVAESGRSRVGDGRFAERPPGDTTGSMPFVWLSLSRVGKRQKRRRKQSEHRRLAQRVWESCSGAVCFCLGSVSARDFLGRRPPPPCVRFLCFFRRMRRKNNDGFAFGEGSCVLYRHETRGLNNARITNFQDGGECIGEGNGLAVEGAIPSKNALFFFGVIRCCGFLVW